MNKILWLLIRKKETIFGLFSTRKEARAMKEFYIEDDEYWNVPQQKYRVIKCKLEDVKT